MQNDEKLNELIDKKIGNEVDGPIINEIFEGYVFKITGGFDKDGFAMKNGILTAARKRILLTKGAKSFRFRSGYHRTGVRKRKLVRGCIVSPDIKILCLKIVKNGPKPIPGIINLSKDLMRLAVKSQNSEVQKELLPFSESSVFLKCITRRRRL